MVLLFKVEKILFPAITTEKYTTASLFSSPFLIKKISANDGNGCVCVCHDIIALNYSSTQIKTEYIAEFLTEIKQKYLV